MKKLLMSALMTAMLMTVAIEPAPVNAQISVGIRIGPPPTPRVERLRPRQPGWDYVWVEGYWYPNPNGRSYRWHSGYWTRPPFRGARWISPHHDGQRFFEGYWLDADRRPDRFRQSDPSRDRDYRR